MLFSTVKYHISSSLPPKRKTDISNALEAYGASEVPLSHATHVVTNSTEFEGWQSVPPNVAVISDNWVSRSLALGRLQETRVHSVDPKMIFSGVIATSADIEPSDKEVIAAGINALGGLFREGLTRDCTHLLVPRAGSDKYRTALHYKDETKIKVVLPHWFDDCFRLMMHLDEEPYEWPNPFIAQTGDGEEEQGVGKTRKKAAFSQEKMALFKTVMDAGSSPTAIKGIESSSSLPVDVWNGRRILLSPSLGLQGGALDSAMVAIKRAGGSLIYLDDPDQETGKVSEADILVTKYRVGSAYIKAINEHKTVSSLAWIFHVNKVGVITRPEDQILHYPIPKKPIQGFQSHVITVTNYTGESRDYLKKVITTMGATFTPTMSSQNTMVIAASISGQKAEKAREWSIPVVNHIWLEDCFVQWRNLTAAVEKYILFPPGTDFGNKVGDRGVGRIQLTSEDLLEMEEDDKQHAEQQKKIQLLTGTGKSARDAQEVENVVGFEGSGPEQVAPSRKNKVSKPLKSKKSIIEQDDMVEEAQSSQTKDKLAKMASSVAQKINTKNRGADKPGPSSLSLKRRAKEDMDAESSDHEHDARLMTKALSGKPSTSTKKASVFGKSNGPQRTKAIDIMENDAESEDDDLNLSPVRPFNEDSSKPKSRHVGREDEAKISQKGSVTQPKNAPVEEEEDDDDEGDASPVKASPLSGKQQKSSAKGSITTQDRIKLLKRVHPSGPSPNRVIEVVMTHPPKSLPKTSRSANTSTGPPVRTKSIHITAADASTPTTRRRGRPKARSGTPTSRESSPEGSPDHSLRKLGKAHTAGMIGNTSLPTPSGLQRTPSRRSAASKANQKLRNEIMPDVMNFEKEMRKGSVRGAWEVKGKSSEKDEPPAAKKRRASAVSAEPDGGDEEDGRERKKRKTSEQGMKKEAAANALEGKKDDPATVEKPKKKTGPRALSDSKRQEKESKPHAKSEESAHDAIMIDKSRGSDTNPLAIKLMTTQVTLDDKTNKGLAKLGVKFTLKPAECTHLVAHHLGRTEKFLCAISTAPFVLTEAWAVDSAAAKRILPERDYALMDPENEKKFEFKLSDALRRARETNGKLLDGHTFYVTSKVAVAVDLLKKVAASAGGKILTQTPTPRILHGHDDRHIISCPEDKSIWRALVDLGHPIYTPELIFTGILTQRVDWDNEDYQVPGTV